MRENGRVGMGVVLVAGYLVVLGLCTSFAIVMWRHRRKSVEEILGIWQQGMLRQVGPFLLYVVVGFVIVSWIVNR